MPGPSNPANCDSVHSYSKEITRATDKYLCTGTNKYKVQLVITRCLKRNTSVVGMDYLNI